MDQPGHVLFHVDLVNAQSLQVAVLADDVEVAVSGERQVRLGKLKSLGQVGIVIHLLVEGAPLLNRAIEAERGQRGLLQGLLAEAGQGARQPQADGTGVPVGFIARAVGAIAEHLGGAVELEMDLQTDDRFVFHCLRLLVRGTTAPRMTAAGRH